MKQEYVVSALSVVFLFSCWGNQKEYQNILRPVRVEQVSGAESLEKVYTGVVEAEKYSNLAFKVGGPLVEMNVDAGQRVQKGEVLAVLDASDYELKYEANKAAFVTQTSQLERNRKLLAMQAISKQEFEVGQADYVKTKSAYEAAGSDLYATRLRAPFDGFVERKYVENYQKVQPGEQVVRLVNSHRLQISFILPETSVRLTRIPLRVSVEFDTYKGMWFHAKVKMIVDASSDGNGIPVKLTIDDERFVKEKLSIYPGFSCKVNLQVVDGTVGDFSVPLSAVFKDLQTDEISVWLYEAKSGRVKRQTVKVEQLFGRDRILIREGLKPDDMVVVEGATFVTDGQQVSLLNDKK